MKTNILKLLLTVFLFLSSYSFSQIYESANDIKPLLIGNVIPDAELVTVEGEVISLQEKIAERPSVLIFYRGGWCPFCNKQLAGLAEIESKITKLGYQIIAISPENHKENEAIIKSQNLEYTLLSDENGELIKAMGIAFRMDEKTRAYLDKKNNSNSEGILPVASVFVINPKAEILFQYINPNYKKRLSGELLLAVLENL